MRRKQTGKFYLSIFALSFLFCCHVFLPDLTFALPVTYNISSDIRYNSVWEEAKGTLILEDASSFTNIPNSTDPWEQAAHYEFQWNIETPTYVLAGRGDFLIWDHGGPWDWHANFNTNVGLETTEDPNVSALEWVGNVMLKPSTFSVGSFGLSTSPATGDSYSFRNIEGQMESVPEPGTIILFGIGLVGLAGARIRSKK